MEKEPTQDKCQVCSFVATPEVFEENADKCPVCGSTDIDDVTIKPYEEDEEGGNLNLH